MPKILYYGSSTQIHSGAAQWMYRLADGMRNYGYETVAVLPSNKGIAEWYHDADIDVRYHWSEPLRQTTVISQVFYLFMSFLTTLQLLVLIRREQIDIVHINEVRHLPGLLAGWISGAMTVCHVRVCFENRHMRKMFGAMITFFADEAVCVSNRTAELMFESAGHSGNYVHVLHDGAPAPERFENLPNGQAFRDEFNINKDTTLVVCVSKLTHNKGQDRVVDAASSLTDEDIQFAIVGGTVKGHEDYADQLQERVSSLPNIRLTGFYSDLSMVLGAADILVHVPRHEDPFPGVVLEGMISELPVIGSKSGGIPEQIEHEETGFLVPKDEPNPELTERIRSLAMDVKKRRKMGQRGRNRVLSQHDPGQYYKAIAKLYDTTTEVA